MGMYGYNATKELCTEVGLKITLMFSSLRQFF
jgi:hypothetical protein